MQVKVCLDYQKFRTKHDAKKNVRQISERIADLENTIELQELINEVGNNGRTFTPATFTGNRDIRNFKEMQIFGLDLDEGNISCEEIIKRGKKFNVPVAFIYETFSSTEKLKKYRVGFVHTIPINNPDIALFILRILYRIYPEADKSCVEVARMYFGGKRVVYYNPDISVFQVDNLAREYQIYSKETDEAHFAANQAAIIKGLRVPGLGKNKLFNIDTYTNGRRVVDGFVEDGSTESCENLDSTNIVILDVVKKSQKIVFYPSIYQQDMCEKKRTYIGTHVKSDTISKMCCLWREFINGGNLSHEDRFLLATNVVHIKGLETVFLKVIYQYYDSYYRWKYYLTYNASRGYCPKSCDSCPYAKECVHEKNMVLTVTGRKSIVRLDMKPKYVSLDAAYSCLENALYDAVFSNDESIHLIRAQTSLGKTQAFVNLSKIKEGRKPLLIAVPLIRLKEEVTERLPYGEGEQILSWKQLGLPLELVCEIEALYGAGYYKDAKSVIKKFAKDNQISEYDMIKKYENYMDILEKAESNIVITHAQLKNIKSDVLKKYELIVDEDWLFTALRNSGSISVHNVKKLIDSGAIGGNKLQEIEAVIKESKEKYFKCQCKDKIPYCSQEEMNQLGISGDVNGFLNADVYCYSEQAGTITFMNIPMLPQQKVTILSATLNEKIYQLVFKSRRIVLHDIPKVKYQGRLIQYAYYSLSRKNIRELCEKTQMTCEEVYQHIIECCGEVDYGITFMQNENLLGKEHCHFGNAIGIDKYKGKCGIIIGTPFLNENAYKMTGIMLGIDVDKCTMSRRRVTYSGYEFPLNTYDDETLRMIQLYFLASELEQCIGRSRLLRTDATVYLFSSFPCEQSEICLKDYMETKITSVSVTDTPE